MNTKPVSSFNFDFSYNYIYIFVKRNVIPFTKISGKTKISFLSDDSGWGNNLFCGLKQGLSWGEKLSKKGSVKQTIAPPILAPV